MPFNKNERFFSEKEKKIKDEDKKVSHGGLKSSSQNFLNPQQIKGTMFEN